MQIFQGGDMLTTAPVAQETTDLYEERFEEYLNNIVVQTETSGYNCKLPRDRFLRSLKRYFEELRLSIRDSDIEKTHNTLLEIRSFINDKLWVSPMIGGRREIDFYDDDSVDKLNIHKSMDGLRDLIALEIFKLEKAADAYDIFYPPRKPMPTLVKVIGAVGAAVGIYFCGHYNGEKSAVENLESEKDAPAEVQQR